MKSFSYPARAVLVGLVSTQVIATVHVFLSNAELYRTLSLIADAGYIPIPNQHTSAHLQELRTAFFGGLFFTLTVGSVLSILALAAAWVWKSLFSEKKLLLIPFLLVWLGCLLKINFRGISPVVSSYFLIIPALVFWVAVRWTPIQTGKHQRAKEMACLIPIALLALLFVPQMTRHLFLDLRDNLLLSSCVGTKINDFYYTYNLYPAEAFKSLDQKILKTCSLRHIKKEPFKRLLETKLLNHDYLNIGRDTAVDLSLREEGKMLVFVNRGKEILRNASKDFLSRRDRVLKEFSSNTDIHAFFRRFTFFGLLVGFPITLYIFLYAFLRFLFGLFLGPKASSVGASTACFVSGVALWIPLYMAQGFVTGTKDLATALESGRWQERVSALKLIKERRMDVSDFEAYKGILKSPNTTERYWLAKALGYSRKPETYADLLAFLDDPHPCVVSMAYDALGHRGDARAIKEILKRFNVSDNWYNQWYAYKALRALEWKQTRSK